MATVQEKPQNLSALAGKLGGSFNAVTLRQLNDSLIATKPAAARALDAFYAAADALHEKEEAFRARKLGETPDLKKNLRSAEHFAALRDFRDAADALSAQDPAHAHQIISAVEKSIAQPRRR
jgi:hypothetical protein